MSLVWSKTKFSVSAISPFMKFLLLPFSKCCWMLEICIFKVVGKNLESITESLVWSSNWSLIDKACHPSFSLWDFYVLIRNLLLLNGLCYHFLVYQQVHENLGVPVLHHVQIVGNLGYSLSHFEYNRGNHVECGNMLTT